MNKSNVKNINPEAPIQHQDLIVEFVQVIGYDAMKEGFDQPVFQTETFENVKGFTLSSHWVSITKEDGNSVAIPYYRIRSIQQSFKD